MTRCPDDDPIASPAVEIFLLGQVDFQRCAALQERLIAHAADRDDGQIAMLICEHPAVITVGRDGSPAELAIENRLLRTREIEVHWVNRRGGCMLHCPGQLAIYPIVPLGWHGFSFDQYQRRLQAGLAATLDELRVRWHALPGRHGLWGRTGQLAALGAGLRDGITWHGAFLNVSPAMGLFRLVDGDPIGHTRMSSLTAERCGPPKMPMVRAALVRRLVEAFGGERYHLYTGHPWLRKEIANCKM